MPKTHRKVIDAIIGLSHGSLRYCFLPVRELRRAADTSFAAAATATVPAVSTLRPSSGSKTSSCANSQAITSCSPSPSQSSCALSSAKPAHRLRRAVRGLLCGDQEARPRSKAHGGRTPGLLGRAAHLGPNSAVSPPHPLHGPGWGALSADGRWHPSSVGFYLPVQALSAIFRAKFRDRDDASRAALR